MKSASWIVFTARRYISARRRDKSSPSSLLSVLGIAVGVLALTVVLAVMNGFQLGFIESILEISSYHVRIEAAPTASADEALLTELRSLPFVSSALPFLELQTIARGEKRSQLGCLVRGVPQDAPERDAGLVSKLDFEEGAFDLSDPRSLLLGAELARGLGLHVGDEITLLSLTGSALANLEPDDARFRVAGIFRSGFYEYDLGWAFISLDAAIALHGGEVPLVYGVKLRDRWADADAVAAISRLSGASSARVISWRSFNRAFFGALRTEKILMFILVGLIFVVVGLSVFQAQRRAVMERADEIALLRAVGASELAVRLVFTCDGFIVGFSGAVAGMIPALLIASNIQGFFSFLEIAVNSGIAVVNAVASLLTGGSLRGADSFSIFSPTVFYLKEIPSRVLPHEAALIFLFGLSSATVAAALASGRVARFRPAEVLRYE
jgi:lipoprotein-releasing system permease protein